MDFGAALAALKSGRRVRRAGWNAAGQWVTLQRGYPDGIAINANTASATGIEQGTVKRFRPYLMLHAVQGDFVPWAPTVSDVLADDWTEVRGDGDPARAVKPEPDAPTQVSVVVNVHGSVLTERDLGEIIRRQVLQGLRYGAPRFAQGGPVQTGVPVIVGDGGAPETAFPPPGGHD